MHDYGLIYQRLLIGEGHHPSNRLDWQTAVRGHVNKGVSHSQGASEMHM